MKQILLPILLLLSFLSYSQLNGDISIHSTEVLVPSSSRAVMVEVTLTNNESSDWIGVEFIADVPQNAGGNNVFTIVDGSGELLETPISNTISEGIKTPLGVG